MARHHINASPIFLTILGQAWISDQAKVRMLEWKIRMDLLQYAACACPALSLAAIETYTPNEKKYRDCVPLRPFDLVSRLHFQEDDGHAIKLGRAALICNDLSQEYDRESWAIIRGRETWMKIFYLIVDSIEGSPKVIICNGLLDDSDDSYQGPPGYIEKPVIWVHTTGLDEA